LASFCLHPSYTLEQRTPDRGEAVCQPYARLTNSRSCRLWRTARHSHFGDFGFAVARRTLDERQERDAR